MVPAITVGVFYWETGNLFTKTTGSSKILQSIIMPFRAVDLLGKKVKLDSYRNNFTFTFQQWEEKKILKCFVLK